jgi:hypothetical protein
MRSRIGKQLFLLTFAVGVGALALTLNGWAQVQTDTVTTVGHPTTEVKVDRAKVVVVDGNDLVVKTEDGRLVHFANVPADATATVDGQQLGIHDLKPGMTLERTITTRTIPLTITTVKTVTGTVWYANPPNSVVLTLEDGTNQEFKIPAGQQFNIDGQMTDAWGLKKGMKITATKVTEVPQDYVDQQKQITGTMPPPEPPVDLPILLAFVEVIAPAPPPVPATTAAVTPAALPQTASQLPLIGFLGALALVSGLGLRVARLRAVKVRK